MNEKKTSINTRIKRKHLKIAIGIFICLVSVFCMLNFGYTSRFIFWAVSFFTGSLLAYIFYGILFIYGLTFIIQKKWTVRNLNLLIIGLGLIFFGVLIITTHQMTLNNDISLTFKNFRSEFIKSLNLNQFPKLNLASSGGIIGFTVVAILNSSIQPLGTVIFGSIFICVGTILLLARPIIYLIRSINDDRKDVSENKKAYNEYNEEVSLLSGNLNLSRDGDLDYTEEDAKNDKPILSSMPYALPEPEQEAIKEIEEPEIKNEVVQEEPVVAPSYEPMEEQIEVPEEPQVNLHEDDEKTLISTPQFENDYQNNFVDNGLHRVKFVPDDEVKLDTNEQRNEEKNNEYSRKEPEYPQYKEELYENKSDDVDTFNYEEPTSYENESSNYQEPTENVDYEEKEEIYEEVVSKPEPTRVVSEPIKPTREERKIESVDASKSNDNGSIIPDLNSEDGPFMKQTKHIKYQMVSTDLLDMSVNNEAVEAKNIEACNERMAKMNELMTDFNIGAKVISYKIGPSVTRYDLQTERSYSISGFDKNMKDISVRLGGLDARFVPVIQGKTTSGIEVENESRAIVKFKDVYEHLPRPKPGKLEIPFGVNISGEYISADLTKFPHMLVAGTTGSGKSIYIHSVLLSLIMRNSMEDLRIVLIDPKQVEFKKYEGIPHLLCPIITEPNEAYATLMKLAEEMDERFQIFSAAGVSDLEQYNELAAEKGAKKLPLIVLVVDEFADLMDNNKNIQSPVSRLGAKARAAGIHMIIATQRPSTDVITGVIKSNLSVRVALMASSPTDSVVVLGEGGAEKLLGNGDMLVMCSLVSKQEKTRVQGCLVTNSEINRIVDAIKAKYPLIYDERFVGLLEKSRMEATDLHSVVSGGSGNEVDSMYDKVKEYLMTCDKDRISINGLINEFSFGYKRSSNIYYKLIEEGILERPEHSNSARGAKILVKAAPKEEEEE